MPTKAFKRTPVVRTLAKAFGMSSSSRWRLLETLPKGTVGAEIGVHLGDFSESILSIARPKKLYLIDPWKYEDSDDYKDAWYGGASEKEQELEERYRSVQSRFSSKIQSGQVVVMRQDSESALNEFRDGELDFVYIDGNHLYDFAKRDLEISLRKVKSGGFITGDDYETGGWWKGGVKKAVDEFGWNENVSLKWIDGRQFVFQVK